MNAISFELSSANSVCQCLRSQLAKMTSFAWYFTFMILVVYVCSAPIKPTVQTNVTLGCASPTPNQQNTTNDSSSTNPIRDNHTNEVDIQETTTDVAMTTVYVKTRILIKTPCRSGFLETADGDCVEEF